MDISVYKLFHVVGILLVFQGIGGAIALAGADRGAPWRRASRIGHGIGMLLLLVAGFGMLAKLELMTSMPAWVWVKLVAWLALGALPSVLQRRPSAARAAWGLALGLGTLAAAMAVTKPF